MFLILTWFNALKGVPEKLRKRLQPWKGKNITSGGRLLLTNTSLSSLPIGLNSFGKGTIEFQISHGQVGEFMYSQRLWWIRDY